MRDGMPGSVEVAVVLDWGGGGRRDHVDFDGRMCVERKECGTVFRRDFSGRVFGIGAGLSPACAPARPGAVC